MAVYGVTNPAPGTYPGSDFALQWQSSTSSGTGAVGYASQGTTFGSLTWTPNTSLVGNHSAVWTATVQSPVAVAAGQSWTLTAPWTFPSDSASYQAAVNHGGTVTPTEVSASGNQVTLTLPNAVAAGDTVTLTVSGITNPATGSQSGSAWTVAAGGATMTAAQGYTWVASEPSPTVHVTSYQAGAPGVTWTLAFPAEAALNGGNLITLYDEGAGLPSDPAEYHLSVAGGPSQAPTAVQFPGESPSQCTAYCVVNLTLPQTLTASPLETLQVQVGGVTNPTGPIAELTVSTTGVPVGSMEPFPSSGAGTFGPAGIGGNPSASGEVTLAPSTIHPLPAEPLKSASGGTLSLSMQPLNSFGCVLAFNKDLQSGGNFSGYTCGSVLWNPTNPPGSGGAPAPDYTPQGASQGVFVAQSPTVTMPIYDASGCPKFATELPSADGTYSSCQRNVYAAAVETGSGGVPQVVKLPSTFQYSPPPVNSQGYQTQAGDDTLTFTLPKVGTTVTSHSASTSSYTAKGRSSTAGVTT